MQIRQRLFNSTNVQIMHFLLDKILKLLTYYTFVSHCKVVISKTDRFFWPTLYIL